MEPSTTSTARKGHAMDKDEEIKDLKLKIIELTRELEKKEERENNCVCLKRQDEQTHEKIRMIGSVMSMSSEGVDSPLNEIQVKEEPEDEFIPEDLQSDTQSMDEEIDIKEEEIGYGLNVDESSQIPIKFEPELDDRSIRIMLDSANHVANTELDSGGVGTNKVGIDSSPSSLRKNVLFTRTAENIYKCKTCPATFDTQYKLLVHVNFQRGKKVRPTTPKALLNCSICEERLSTTRLLAIHMKTHKEEMESMSVRIDKELPVKRSLPVENEKGRSCGRPKKQRKVIETETEERNDEEMSGGGDGIDPPGVVEVGRNPLKKKKILRRILSNLGKQDLLNARLVSRAWNVRSLKVLRKSKFTQLLRDWKMEQYIRFATPNEPRPVILPFHLNFSISSSSAYLARYNRILTSHVDSLCQMFGPHCVSTLTLKTDDTDWTYENIKEIGLIKCLALISPGLKTLDLKSFDVRIHFLKNQMMTFPNLKKLICNTSECESGRSGPGLTYISIIENSPNLEDLTLTDPCDLDSWPLNFNQLKSLSLSKMFKPQNILNKILSSSEPRVLQELSILLEAGESWSAEDKIAVYKILKSVSTTLRSLIFRGIHLAQNTGNLRFPKLPHLEHFGLEYNFGNTSRRNPENLDFSPENFPSLKSIELPIGFIFAPSPVQSEDDGVSIEFPSLNKLILRLSPIAGPEKVNEALEQLQQKFPSPSKICLVNVGARGRGFVKYILYRIMTSNWYKSIQEIDMIAGFSRKDLPGILDQMGYLPQAGLGHWYLMLKKSVETEFENPMNRMRMEFEGTFGTHDSII